ncbi:putative monooxygenase [Wickerhamomyces ciferrii]|uniref:Monooxygenase n=1 Tax=Wickerhamomyces ciferrii (strain ATCC 14091 / BCRC 22168 / CBS 111 / JCM 3599 / NBRC 0793 / NRRL Y-1031 F-60-10) TaxID=1206466 RepID=K0KRI9_WICCF|nr:putative monooxygenase [Wickerhamomyces ciferrii]CCH43938.1 putative monooxygenase [Wickerhamomyces ciferrii]
MSEPPTKKARRTKRTEPLIINFFEALTPVLHAPGQWRNPIDQSRNYTKPEYWIKIAQLAERGKLHGLFFGDSLAVYGGYKSQGLGGPYNYEEAAKSGNNFPKNDPTAYISALAISTKNISFGITCSTLSEHPYHFARRYSTLDHITGGRMGWNVVTSFLPSAGRQLAPDGKLAQKELRYEKADEYLQVFYELLLSSWRDDGVVFDRERGVFSDPEAIREINFDGTHYRVPGPQISEPSPQRIPVIIQAGASPKGLLLGAKHAELIYVGARQPEVVKEKIDATKKLAKEKFGRDPSHIKFVTRASVVLGKTHEEAIGKYEEIKKYNDPEGIYVQMGGGGLDISKFSDDEDLTTVDDPQAKSTALSFHSIFPGETITKKFIAEHYHDHNTLFVDTAEEVADQIEDFVEKSGIDGFNFTNLVLPQTFEDIVDLLIPELQERGLAQKEYAVDGGTYREQIYREKGHTFVPEDHYAYPLRWKAGVSKEEFEEHVAKLKEAQKKYAIKADE